MKRYLPLLIFILIASSCKSKKTYVSKKNKVATVKVNTTNKEAEAIVESAKDFLGTRYKYGGDSKRGMDCSGLVVKAFMKEDIKLPRTTSDLSKTGDWIDVKAVREGDLLFFATKKNSRKINHVGIVTKSRPGYVEFIHSTTSKGVIRSTLSERYWYLAYVQARRIM